VQGAYQGLGVAVLQQVPAKPIGRKEGPEPPDDFPNDGSFGGTRSMKRPPGTERPLDPTLGYPARGPTIWRRRSNSGRDNLIGRRPVPGPAPMPAGLGGYQGKHFRGNVTRSLLSRGENSA